MCVSLLVENDPGRLAAALGVAHVALADESTSTRVEARGAATIVRIGAGGRVVGETMTFNPYILRKHNVAGDIWADRLLGESHGLLVLRAFSEWTSADRLVANRLISVIDVNCAFNRFATAPGRGYADVIEPRERWMLGNFKPYSGRPLLVPVLFDQSRQPHPPHAREFALISQDPDFDTAATGAAHAPVSLTPEAAMTWIHAVIPDEAATESDPGILDLDLSEVLEDGRNEAFQFSLFKSA